jgi:hypothetical protein
VIETHSLNLLNFYLWSHWKSLVYSSTVYRYGKSLKQNCCRFSDARQHVRKSGWTSRAPEASSWSLHSGRRWTYGALTVW